MKIFFFSFLQMLFFIAYFFRSYTYRLVAIERPSQGGVAGGVVCGISGIGGFVSARSARLKAGWWAKGLMLHGRQSRF
jgi:hypothetical protein